MLKVTRSQLQPYGIAVFSVVSALLLTRLLQPLLTPTIFILFFPAVVVSALYGGMGSGLLATILSVLVCKYFFLAPVYSLTILDQGTGVRLVLFLLVTLLITTISSSLRTTRRGTEVSLLKLRASEERYRVLAENVPQLVWISRADGFVEYFNQRWFDYTGLKLDETLGWEWQQVIHPEDLPSILELWKTGLSTGNRVEAQYRLKRSDGIYRWYITRAVPLHNPNGEIANWFGTSTDIHDQKQAEEGLRQSQERLGFLANASRLLATSLDYETTLASVARLAVPYLADICVVDLVEENQAPYRVAVAHIDPSKEKLLHELVRRYPPFWNEVSPLHKALSSGQSVLVSEMPESLLVEYTQDSEHLKLLQEIGSFCSSMAVPLIAHGRTLGAISFGTTESGRHYSCADLSLAEDLAHRIALAVDNARLYRISESARKAAQEAEQALRQSEARLRRVVESNMIGIGVWNRNGKITEANDALLQLVGYTQEDVQAGNLYWQQLTAPEYQSVDENALKEIEALGICTPFEKDYIHKDGKRTPILIGGARFEDTPDSGVFFVLDLSERKRAEQERIQLLEVLESKQRLLEAVLQQMPAGLIVASSPSGRFVLMNEQVQQILFGAFPIADQVEDYLPEPFQAFYPDGRLYTPEELPLARSLHTGEVVREEEIDTVCGDGTQRTVLVDSSPIRNAEGQILAAVVTFYDITERKRSRERIQLYADVVKNVQVGLVVWQLEDLEDPGSFRLITANPAGCQFTGVDFEALIGTTMAESFPALLETQLILDYVEVVRTGQPKDLGEVRYGDERVSEGMFSLKAFPLPNRCFGLAFENITERKQVEEALGDALQRLNFHVENTPLAVIERDRDFRITRWSHSAERIFGWQAEEVIGKDPNEWQTIYVEDIEVVNTLRTRLLNGLEKQNISRNRSYRKDGSIIHCEWYNSALLDESGNLVSVLSLVLDVTERKQAEEALKNSQERLKLAQTVGKIGSWEWNLQTHEIIWTEELEAVYGLAPGSFDGNYETWLQTLHPDDRSRIEQDSGGSITEGREFNSEFRIFWPDGSLHWIAAKFQAFNDDTGKPWRVIGVNMDITDRKQADEALRQSEERFRIAQDLSLDAFTIMHSVRDAAGEIIDFEWDYVNPKAAEILQSTIKDLKGHRLLQVLPGNKTNSELFGRYVQVVETGIPHDIEISYNSEGITGWFRNMAVKLNDGIVVSFSDITSRKQAEVERINLLEREKAARTQAEAANRIKDEFLAVLSHELRSPLNPILGWSKLLQSRKFDEATTARALEIIERNAKLQIQLIEDLLDVSRILRGKLSLNIYPVNLVPTIEAALETVRLAASAKSIQIQSVYEPNVGQVSGDSGRLQQVIWNLLSNAVKFTPQGGCVEIRLSVVSSQSQRTTDKYAQIQVSDTGKGINPDFLPHVFDYFRQENSTTTRLFGGLGLGLAIVRHLVELHGGTVSVESPGEGQGATFTVQLPLMITQPETNPDNQQFNESPNLSGIRVLVVDDEADMREFLAFMLEEYGAKVTVVASASEALEALCQVKPEVLVSDIGMPEVDGYMLIRQIRAMPPEQGGLIPAIALTAYAGEADQNQALSAGFHKHIAKPVEPNELATVIASVAIGNSNV
jgi:PAS domain S-box-containing protein